MTLARSTHSKHTQTKKTHHELVLRLLAQAEAGRGEVAGDEHGAALRFEAIRDVAEGEELLFCYAQPAENEGRRERRALLQSQYLFRCECAACLADGEGPE